MVPVNILEDGYPNKSIGYLDIIISLQLIRLVGLFRYYYITTTNTTSIVFTYNTVIPGVYDTNVSAVNTLVEIYRDM